MPTITPTPWALDKRHALSNHLTSYASAPDYVDFPVALDLPMPETEDLPDELIEPAALVHDTRRRRNAARLAVRTAERELELALRRDVDAAAAADLEGTTAPATEAPGRAAAVQAARDAHRTAERSAVLALDRWLDALDEHGPAWLANSTAHVVAQLRSYAADLDAALAQHARVEAAFGVTDFLTNVSTNTKYWCAPRPLDAQTSVLHRDRDHLLRALTEERDGILALADQLEADAAARAELE